MHHPIEPISKQPRRAGPAAPPARRKRRGWASLELVLTLPILLVLLMGLLEFSLLFYARSSLVEASRVGARAATLAGIDQKHVEQEVRRILPPALLGNLQVDYQPGGRSGELVTVAVHVPMQDAAPDLLWIIGYGLEGRELYAETNMIRE